MSRGRYDLARDGRELIDSDGAQRIFGSVQDCEQHIARDYFNGVIGCIVIISHVV